MLPENCILLLVLDSQVGQVGPGHSGQLVQIIPPIQGQPAVQGMVNLQYKEGSIVPTYSTKMGNFGQLVQIIPPIQGQSTVQGRVNSTRKGRPTIQGRITPVSLSSSSQPLRVSLQYKEGSRRSAHPNYWLSTYSTMKGHAGQLIPTILAGLITQNTVISVQKNLPAWLV